MSAPDRILTEAQCAALAERVFSFQQGGGEAAVQIISHWSGELRWGRNRVTLASDRQETNVQVQRTIHRATASVETNQLEPAALEAAVRATELRVRYLPSRFDDFQAPYVFTPDQVKPAIWSDATYALTMEAQAQVARAMIDPAEAAEMLSAGYLAAEAQAYAVITSQEQRWYARMTQGRCAVTVRDPQGSGSGWAGKTSYDWSKIDTRALGERAVRKCLASRNPVALEPGRYTVVLEPQAVADLLDVLVKPGPLSRVSSEDPPAKTPFFQRPQFAKLGMKVADERVTIGQDPMDPNLGVMPFAANGDPQRAMNWIERGVLRTLAHDRGYALSQLNENLGFPNSGAYHMVGGSTSIEEMIGTTKRGLLVTRLWDVDVIDDVSLLSTGFTRDGLWLIEHGKITQPVKNFRFAESPLFVLNNLEQLGPAEVVFRPGGRGGPLLRPAVVPPLKARDFNFTALIDAV